MVNGIYRSTTDVPRPASPRNDAMDMYDIGEDESAKPSPARNDSNDAMDLYDMGGDDNESVADEVETGFAANPLAEDLYGNDHLMAEFSMGVSYFCCCCSIFVACPTSGVESCVLML